MEKVTQNLKDAGCDAKVIERFFQLATESRTEEQLRLLSGHRASLLEKIHRYQKKLDCLDYLIYHMRKDMKQPSTVGR